MDNYLGLEVRLRGRLAIVRRMHMEQAHARLVSEGHNDSDGVSKECFCGLLRFETYKMSEKEQRANCAKTRSATSTKYGRTRDWPEVVSKIRNVPEDDR